MPKPTPFITIPPPAKRPAKPDYEQQTIILVQPASHLIEKGCPVTFSVVAAGFPPEQADELTYEWQLNTAPKAKPVDNPTSKIWSDFEFFDKGFEKAPDSPNAPLFTIPKVSKDDVAFYRVKVTPPGEKAVVSKPAQLWVWEEVDSVIVHGTVYQQTGGPRTCPGSYNKRVDYPAVWPDAVAPGTAKDQQNFGTWIEWFDYYYVGGCGVTPIGSQQIPVAVANNVTHYFTIYIPAGKAIPWPYDIYLTNFHS